jgi:hypothetical protein
MNISQTLTYLDQQITSQKASLKNSLFILSMAIEDDSGESVEETIQNYYNAQLISCKVKRCNKTGEYEIAIWW